MILTSHFYKELHNKVKDVIISMKKSNSLNDIINITIRIDNRQYKKYIDKKIKIKTHLIKRFFKENSMKLNITKIKELKTKAYYIYKKKII